MRVPAGARNSSTHQWEGQERGHSHGTVWGKGRQGEIGGCSSSRGSSRGGRRGRRWCERHSTVRRVSLRPPVEAGK